MSVVCFASSEMSRGLPQGMPDALSGGLASGASASSFHRWSFSATHPSRDVFGCCHSCGGGRGKTDASCEFPFLARGQDGSRCRDGRRSEGGSAVTDDPVFRTGNRDCRFLRPAYDGGRPEWNVPATGLCPRLSVRRSKPGVGGHRSSACACICNGSVRPYMPGTPLAD